MGEEVRRDVANLQRSRQGTGGAMCVAHILLDRHEARCISCIYDSASKYDAAGAQNSDGWREWSRETRRVLAAATADSYYYYYYRFFPLGQQTVDCCEKATQLHLAVTWHRRMEEVRIQAWGAAGKKATQLRWKRPRPLTTRGLPGEESTSARHSGGSGACRASNSAPHWACAEHTSSDSPWWM